jgi:hypothetical protein
MQIRIYAHSSPVVTIDGAGNDGFSGLFERKAQQGGRIGVSIQKNINRL